MLKKLGIKANAASNGLEAISELEMIYIRATFECYLPKMQHHSIRCNITNSALTTTEISALKNA